ncbi:MAG: AI-2E family transporter [Verrucomicrobia bacterium]|nr:AI-2E family transporter [Verrucomicrobiota bacterium]MCH8513367.1 AI-2E family transporter [Kiritimatiellia bacterium]
MSIPFSERQHKIIATALTGLACLILAGLVLLTFQVIIRFMSAFSSVLLPLVTAGILSLLLRPFAHWVRAHSHLPASLSVLTVFVCVLTPVVLLSHFFGLMLVQQFNQFIAALPGLLESLWHFIDTYLPALAKWMDAEGGEALQEAWGEHQQAFLRVAMTGAQGFFGFLGAFGSFLGWLVMPVYLFFFMVAPPFHVENFGQFFPFLKEETRKDLLFLVRQFVEIVVTYFRGQFSVALIQGVMMAVGFTVFGLTNGFVLGIIFGLSNLVPYLGNLLGLTVTLPLAFMQPGGGWGLVLAVLGVLAVTQVVESYYLTPKIIGNKTGLHPMAVIFAMFFWGRAIGGIFGLVVAVPLTAFLVVFWRLAREKYLPKTAETPQTTPKNKRQAASRKG